MPCLELAPHKVTMNDIMQRDTRNQPNSTHPSPPDIEPCKHHRQRHKRNPCARKEKRAAVIRAPLSRWSRDHPCVLVPTFWQGGHVTTLPEGDVVRRAPEQRYAGPRRRVIPTAVSDLVRGGHVSTYGLVPIPRTAHGKHSLGYIPVALVNHPHRMHYQVMQAVGCRFVRAKPG